MKPEERLQIASMNYIRLQYPNIIAFHVRNEGIKGTKAQKMAYGAKYKKMGVLKGVSDIIILEPKAIYHGLMIELKLEKTLTQRKTYPSKEQKEFLSKCSDKGYMTRVCRSVDEVVAIVDLYMNL
jgi:hypothetical protein